MNPAFVHPYFHELADAGLGRQESATDRLLDQVVPELSVNLERLEKSTIAAHLVEIYGNYTTFGGIGVLGFNA